MISLFSILTPAAYCAAIYFGANYYNYDIDSFLIQRAYDCIFVFGYIQIMVRNSNFYKNIIKHYKTTMSTFRNEIEVIINNKPVQSTKKTLLFDNPPESFDLIVYKCDNAATLKTDNVVFFQLPTEEMFEYSRCKYTFIQIMVNFECKENEQSYKLNLCDQTNNYYVVNNRINAKFISYMLFKNYNVSCDFINTPYTIHIMDHNVGTVILNENDELIFNENDYTIISDKDETEENSEDE